MKGKKFLVLSTLAVFCSCLGSVGIYRAVLAPRPIVIVGKEYPTIGRDFAPVDVVVFEDFLCHTCRYFSIEVFPAIDSTYVERGVARYTMVPLAFSPRSREMANAALAVYYQAPQHYFSYVHELFLRYADGKGEMKNLVELAAKYPGINLETFEASIKTGRYDHELDENFKVAKKAMKKNIRIPAVFVNGYAMPGISFESISVQIESILNNKRVHK